MMEIILVFVAVFGGIGQADLRPFDTIDECRTYLADRQIKELEPVYAFADGGNLVKGYVVCEPRKSK